MVNILDRPEPWQRKDSAKTGSTPVPLTNL
nr:MAG TPA: hypothetical protein [Caudoviricetes sp.]